MKVPKFVLWKWEHHTFRTIYKPDHVNQISLQLMKHGVPQENIVCITDDPTGVKECKTFPLWGDLGGVPNVSGPHLPSCYRRLKLFDRATQEQLGFSAGDMIVSFDLDAVILQKFLGLFEDQTAEFTGWFVPGTRHPTVLNGSMWMIKAGTNDWVWKQFDPHKSPGMAARAGYMGSDQGYLSHCLIGRDFVTGWTAQKDGVLSYMRDVRRPRLLPRHARIVFFPGRNKPWDPHVLKESSWIKRYIVEEPPDFKDQLIGAV